MADNPEKSKQQEKNEREGASILNATVNMIKGGIGTGILFMPYCFKSVGIILSGIILVLMAGACFYCWYFVSKMARILEGKGLTYKGEKNLCLNSVSGIVLGPRYETFLRIITLLFAFSVMIGYFIFISSTIKPYSDYHKYIVILAIGVVFLPLSMFKQIRKLGIFNQFAVLTLSASILTICIYSIIRMNTPTIQIPFKDGQKLFDFGGLASNFGSFAFAFDTNSLYGEVHSSMKHKIKFSLVLLNYLVVACVLFMLMGSLGYLGFGETICSNIFLNLKDIKEVKMIISIAYSISIIFNIILYSFPITAEFDRIIMKYSKSIFIQFGFRALLFAVVCVAGVFIENLTLVISLIGCVFPVILTYFIPIALFEKLKYLDRKGIELKSVELALNESPPLPTKEGSNKQKEDDADDEEEDQIENKLDHQITEEPRKEEIETLPTSKIFIIANILIIIIGLGGGAVGIQDSIREIIKFFNNQQGGSDLCS